MALETATPNRRALDLLKLDEKSRVLEVGFGHGHTLARAAELAPKGFVAVHPRDVVWKAWRDCGLRARSKGGEDGNRAGADTSFTDEAGLAMRVLRSFRGPLIGSLFT